MNPDSRLPELDLERLLAPMEDPKVGPISPVWFNSTGGLEDGVRCFPTVLGLAGRVILGLRALSYEFDSKTIDVNWADGKFVMFRRESYKAVRCFDHERFFMYMEDVDICRRLKENDWRFFVQPAVRVIHDAQRASRRS